METFSNKLLPQIKRFFKTESRQILKNFNDIPGPKPLPFVGNIWRYLPLIGQYKPNTLYENALYNKNRYGHLVREQIVKTLTILHLFNPHDIESFFRQDSKYPRRRSHRALLKYRLDRPDRYNDGGLFPENGAGWFRQRQQFQTRLMTKSLVISNIHKLDSMAIKMLQCLDSRVQEDKSTIKAPDFDHLIYKWALGNSLQVFLNLDIDSLDSIIVDKLIQVLHDTLTTIDKTEIQTDKWVKKPNKCPHYKLLVESQDFLYHFVAKHVDKSAGVKPSLLNDWMVKDAICRKDVITFVIDALMAGLHTTSYTLAFLLYNISLKDSVYHKILEELNKNQITPLKPLTNESLEKLVYVRDCLKETFRMNPVSIGTGRLTTDDLVISSYACPKDLMVITQNQVISRDPEVYEEPNSFKPERWSMYKSLPRDQRPSPFATLPFGFGARACIGQRLAEMQLKIIAVRLLQNYNIVFDHQIPVKTTLINNIGGSISVRLRPSTKSQ